MLGCHIIQYVVRNLQQLRGAFIIPTAKSVPLDRLLQNSLGTLLLHSSSAFTEGVCSGVDQGSCIVFRTGTGT